MKNLIRTLLKKRNPGFASVEEPTTRDPGPKIKSTRLAPPRFLSERQMKVHYSKNLDEIEPGLRLYSKGKWVGVEVPCSFSERGNSGMIDILAQDKESDLVVIECKLALGSASAFGQLLGYMAWMRAWVWSELKHRRMPKLRRVRGIILCKRASAMLRYLLSSYDEFDITIYEMEPKPNMAPVRR